MAETASDLGSARCFHPLGWRNSVGGGVAARSFAPISTQN